MFWFRVKNCIATALALLFTAGALVCAWALSASRLPSLRGERRYYLDSPSSQAKIVSSLSPLDFARVKGESLSMKGGEEIVEEVIRALGGELLFIEETAGTRSYYGYSPAIFGGLQMGEYFVNWQVAVSGERCVVGTPIIFGGF